jgi:bacterioferritin
MKGNKKVTEQLQTLLNGELAARDQYFAHSRKYKDWGLNKLYEQINHEMEEETEHADLLIERLLFLEAEPSFSEQDDVNIGNTVVDMFKNDLELEYSVVKALKTAILICEQEQDYDSRAILIKLLDDTEMDHTYWLEKQLGLIDKIGLENYLQSQM